MKLIYTYKDFIHNDVEKREIILEYYKKSISRAKSLGYEIELYTNHEVLTNLVDKVYWVNQDYIFWDAYKFIPLEERDDDFLLIDGDVFMHKKLPELNQHDFYFDTFEIGEKNYSNIYKKNVDILTELGIGDFIEEWKPDVKKITCCGILYFNDKKFQKLYLDKWKIFYKFVEENEGKVSYQHCTAIGAQYLLTLLMEYHNKSYHYFSSQLKEMNEYYIHYAGKDKFDRKPKSDILI